MNPLDLPFRTDAPTVDAFACDTYRFALVLVETVTHCAWRVAAWDAKAGRWVDVNVPSAEYGQKRFLERAKDHAFGLLLDLLAPRKGRRLLLLKKLVDDILEKTFAALEYDHGGRYIEAGAVIAWTPIFEGTAYAHGCRLGCFADH